MTGAERALTRPYSTTVDTSTIQHKCSEVSIPIDGETTKFSAVLLRDSCQCPLCVHESTRQRLFSTADIPATIKPQNVEIDTNSSTAKIKWQNDLVGYTSEHTTAIPLQHLRNVKESGSLSGSRTEPFPTPLLWTKKPLDLPDYDYNRYMKDDKPLFELMKQLRIHGLAFVNNIPGLEESLAKVATRMGPIKDTFYGYTWDGQRLSLSAYRQLT